MHTGIMPQAHANARHTILPKPSDSLVGDPGMLFAAPLGMTNAVRTVTQANPRKLKLVSIPPDSEHPTHPDNLKPDAPLHEVMIPGASKLPESLVEMSKRLPPPNQDSYIEMGVSLLLHEMRQREQLDFPAILERQKREFESSLEAGHKMLKSAIIERLGKNENAVEALRTEVAGLKLKIAELEPMKVKLAELEQRLATWPPGQQQ